MTTLAVVGGTVVDGTGAPPVVADVLVTGDRITAVAPGRREADEVLDATGLVVAPGFIDLHSHSDVSLLADGRGLSKLQQGVTSEVVGNCGLSVAPQVTGDARQRDLMAYLDANVDWSWRTYGEYVSRLEGCALNVASLVGHAALRIVVMGYDNRRPTAAELRAMQDLLRECCEAGARGLTSGLIYPPSCYGDGEELAALGAVVREYDGLYASHLRGEGKHLQESVAEALEVGRRSGCRVQISHLKAAGRGNWGGVARAIEQIERARHEGIDVAMDVYPYCASSTLLTALLPSWMHEGGSQALLARLRDPQVRRDLAVAAEDPARAWLDYSLRDRADWDARRITAVEHPENEWMVGRSLWSIAEELGCSPLDALCEIVLRDQARTAYAAFHLSEDDVRTALSHPLAAVGSDGVAVAPTGPLGRGKPHPRFYGTFPRALGHYARDEGLFSLAEAVRKMTSLPASRIGLQDRGRIAVGAAADLVLFDPATIMDVATFEDPHRYPAGVAAVVVNGRVVLRCQQVTAERPGRYLTRAG